MRKIVHLTDPHICREGERLVGLDNYERLKLALAHVRAHHSDAQLLVITGDLTENGEPAEYKRVRELLADMAMPVRLLVGNHDTRAGFRAAFPEHVDAASGFVQSAEMFGDDLLVFLDTKSPTAMGELCAQRLAWLEGTLAAFEGRRVLIFSHHPPTVGEVPHFAGMRFADPERLDAILAADGRVAGLYCGHLHLPLAANWRGVPVTVNGGLSFRIVLNTATPDVDFADAPMSYGVLLTTPEAVIYHTDYVPV